MPRPKRVLTDGEVRQVKKLARVLTMEQLADYLEMSVKTFQRSLKDPRVMAAYKKGKAGAIASVAGTLIKQAREGNTTAAIFYLKTQAGWRERDRQTEEPPMPLDNMSDDQLTEVANGQRPKLKVG